MPPVIDTLSRSSSYTFGDIRVTTWSIIGIIIVLFSTFVFIKVLRILLNRYARRIKLDSGRIKSMFQILKYLIWVGTLIICLDLLHVKITLILASAAALLVGVGFGLQSVFADIISGIIILFDRSIEMEDVIQVNNVRGRVNKIMLRNTIVKTPEDTVVIIPNRKFIDDNVINYSHQQNKYTRYSVSIRVAYGCDTQMVREILMQCAAEHKLVDKSHKTFVRFEEFGESALEFKLFFWSAENFLIDNVLSDLRFMIDKRFRAQNIKIPFPQRDLHIIQPPKQSEN